MSEPPVPIDDVAADAQAAEDARAPGLAATLSASLATILILVLSVLGLLCLRFDLYDDSAMMLGSRLVRQGDRPYLDFYTHYGPLTYDVMAQFLRIHANPAFLLRLAQSGSLLLSGAVLIWLARRQTRARWLLMAVVPVTIVAVSTVSQLPIFLAMLFCLAALALVAALPSHSAERRLGLAAVGGCGLAFAALVRPAFAGYVAGALVVFFLLLWNEVDGRIARRDFAALVTAAVISVAAVWLLLYRPIGVATFWRSAVLTPARLMGGGARFFRPDFFPAFSGGFGSTVLGFLGASVIFATTIAWLLGAASRRVLLIGLGSTLLAATVSVAFLRPGESLLVAAVWFLLAAATAWLGRREIAASRTLSAAAPFGLASTAFAHYFWSRPDRPHLMPLLALAAVGAALVFGAIAPRRRVAVTLLFAAAYISLWRIPWAPFPAMHLFNRGVQQILRHTKLPNANWQSIWPAGELPTDAVQAVFLADHHADPLSRFVAVASSHAQTSGNPILLFLLSSRHPYTKWWAYDPGVQSSSEIQKEMVEELRRSGSNTAVIWPAERYIYEPGIDLSRRTDLDEEVARVYPRVAVRAGQYEIRVRSPR